MEGDAAFRSDWQDVTPVHEDQGLAPVVQVQRSRADAATMDVFQAVLRSGDLSERVLKLTEDVRRKVLTCIYLQCLLSFQTCMFSRDVHVQVIAVNASNYNAWEMRWRCVEVLPPSFMEKEADFLYEMLMNNPKNYQLWNYRRRFAFHRGADHATEVRTDEVVSRCTVSAQEIKKKIQKVSL